MLQRVHAVLAGGLVPLAGFRLRQDTGLDECRLPEAGVEVRTPDCPAAISAREQQLLRDERAVRAHSRLTT